MNKEQQIAELKSKIEELKLKCATLQMRNEVGQRISQVANNLIKNMIKVEKEKAVKEFAGKLWNKIKDNGIDYKIGLRALGEEIDELLKE